MPWNSTTVLSVEPSVPYIQEGGEREGGSPIRAELFLLYHGAISSSTTLASTLLASWAANRASRLWLWHHITMIRGRETNALTYWHNIQCSTVDGGYDVRRRVVTAAEIGNIRSLALVVVHRRAVWGGGGGCGNGGRAAMISSKWSFFR